MPHDHAGHDHAGHAHAGHAHGAGASGRRLLAAMGLTAGYLVAEVVGGLLTGSLALLADAGHMLSDVAALGLSTFAAWLVARPAPPRRTFGYHRAEILAALANGATLLAASGWVVVEAVTRLHAPAKVAGAGMFAVAAGGLAVNLAALAVLHGGREESLNVRGAWLHVLADALGSVGAMAAAVLVWAFGWNRADPVASVLIAALVVLSSWRLLAEAVGVLMESAPRGIDVDAVREAILATPGVAAEHDLHVWAITPGRVCLSVHVASAPDLPPRALLDRLRPMLRDRFGIGHTTIQVEPADYADCGGNGCET